MKKCTKRLQKIRQAGKYISRSKMQRSKQNYQQKITQYGCAHTIQNAEMKQAKKLQHSFVNYTMKIGVINTKQKAN